jgi:hypothetical protein
VNKLPSAGGAAKSNIFRATSSHVASGLSQVALWSLLAQGATKPTESPLVCQINCSPTRMHGVQALCDKPEGLA